MTVHIRIAKDRDIEDIRNLYLHAFPESENHLVARLAVNLLNEKTNPATINLVAEISNAVVGHIAFSPVTINDNQKWPGYILAPLAVKPEHHGTGIGTRLVESGIARLSNDGVIVLFVYGDPEYYGRFGFSAETASKFLPPYKLSHPFGWQAVFLRGTRPNEQGGKLSCVRALRDPLLW